MLLIERSYEMELKNGVYVPGIVAAFSVAADAVLKYVNKNDDRTKALLKVVDLTESFAKDRFKPESYEAARKMIILVS